MNKHIHRTALVGVALIAAGGPANANHSWGNYHWARQANPVVLKLEKQLTAKWDSAFTTAVTDWDQSNVLTLSRSTSNLGVSAKRCSAISGKILVCNDHYGQRGWLGIASIWADGNSHITQGTTKLNDSYFDSPTYNTSAWINMVTCQEIGHDFGLDHQDVNFNNANLGTCMDYTNDPSTNQHPNAHDFEQLVTIYGGHTDGYGTAVSPAAAIFGNRGLGRPTAPGGGADDPGDSAAEWGAAVHRDGLGRPDVFVLNLGGGNRKLTHVLWATR